MILAMLRITKSMFCTLSHALDSDFDRGEEIYKSAARLVPNKNSTAPSDNSRSSTVGASEAFMPCVISCMRLAKQPCLCQFGRAVIRLLMTSRSRLSLGCGGSNWAIRLPLIRIHTRRTQHYGEARELELSEAASLAVKSLPAFVVPDAFHRHFHFFFHRHFHFFPTFRRVEYMEVPHPV